MPLRECSIIYLTSLLLLFPIVHYFKLAMMDNLTTLLLKTSRIISLEEIPICRIVPSTDMQNHKAFLECFQIVL